MQMEELLDTLGYLDSPRFLDASNGDLASAADFGHIFRRAMAPPCSLRGVYTLKSPISPAAPIVPVVYVCQAQSEKEAAQVHRLVWNQDVAPFLIVHTPQGIRLYSGFRYDRPSDPQQGALLALTDFNRVSDNLADFHSEAIDDASLWRNWSERVTPEHRVNWKLLENLRTLDKWLQQEGGLRAAVSHALIGKYVYLYYLLDRKILSHRLRSWGIPQKAVFSRSATCEGLASLVARLDEWLNGSVFPLDLRGGENLEDEHVGLVAATFAGDQPSGDGGWQLHLDFRAYDFSFIPIETLSVVYEQFLHSPGTKGKSAKGKQVGAYYTPIPVVNLMLAEMEDHSPLEVGKKVLDPSCGSGAFLVQCYRKLIEKSHPPGTVPKPSRLRDILTEHIFGVDSDSDACAVAELSLVLTLLDYVQPSELEGSDGFKLPMLRGRNIFCGNFFHESTRQAVTGTTAWPARMGLEKFDWIVGNPPWKKLDPKRLREDELPAWAWMKMNRAKRPVARNQVAQAFAWKVGNHLAKDGEIGMLLPAMTLFEKDSRKFRRSFLARFDLKAVANFANLAEILFAGRSRVPAAAFFYSTRAEAARTSAEESFVAVFSPLVANQEAARNESWSLAVNLGEIRDIPLRQIADGGALPWKLATWGTQFDKRLLRKLARRFPSLGDLQRESRIKVSEGLQLRGKSASEEVKLVREVIGKPTLDMNQLRELRRFFSFPSRALEKLDSNRAYARKRGGIELPLAVCRPPHVIVNAARRFAVYSDDFLVVPPRQIGIASPTADEAVLKALSLYLNSDFAYYHQFLTSPQFGVKRDIATLGALRKIPVPVFDLSAPTLRHWVHLHSQLFKVSRSLLELREQGSARASLFSKDQVRERERLKQRMESLLIQLNEMTNEALRLDRRSRALVHDLVHVRLALIDGKLGQAAVGKPSPESLQSYAGALKSELDGFIGNELPERHAIAVVHNKVSGLVRIDLTREQSRSQRPVVLRADQETARQLEETSKRLRKKHAQWVYFDRDLRIYEGDRIYLLKPMQRFHWTISQAMSDALEIIGEMAFGPGERH